MFRALSAINKGESEEGFQSSSYSEWVKNQTKRYNVQLPNAYPSLMETNKAPAQVLKNSRFSLASWDPNTRQSSIRDIDLASYATSLEYNKDILDLQAKCKSNTLDNLINTESPTAKLRCGWIYQRGQPGYNPKISQANLGTRNGPIRFDDTPSGTWYWSLDAAKKQILMDRCNSLTACEDVGQPNFSSCAFSTRRGIGIPIDNQGQPLYPRDPRLNAPRGSLVTNAAQCPKPPPPGSPEYEFQYRLARSRDVCTPLPNGKLSRDCILQQITAAGCKTDGSLYKELVTSATPANYAAGLENNIAFQKYQRLAQPPLLDDVIKSGQATTSVALANFQRLSANTSGPYSELTFAARDLCNRNGAIEEYNFCNELTDTTSGPFGLSCLQKAFSEAGGQPAGTEYPTQTNIGVWNNLGNWKNVKDRIEILKGETKSTDAEIQAKALQKFYGIKPDILIAGQIPRMNGIETFWFNSAVNGFMGRRVEPNGRVSSAQGLDAMTAAFPSGDWAGGGVANTGRNDQVEFLAMTNLRPPTDEDIRLRVDTDDGMIVTLNSRENVKNTPRGRFTSTNNEFTMNWDQAPTTHVSQTCWKLRGNGPNYVNVWWQESFGGALSRTFYKSCSGPDAWRIVPPQWFTMTQEPEAPMLSFQLVQGNFIERRMPTFFPVRNNTSLFTPIDKTEEILIASNNSFMTVGRSILVNSFRTLTISFRTTKMTKGNLLLFGGLGIVLNGPSVTISWAGRTLQASHTFNGLDTLGGLNYIYLNFRSTYENTYPTTLTMAAGSHSDFLSGRINVRSQSDNVKTYTTNNNDPLYDPINDYATLTIGGSGNAARDATIKNIRFFDYELHNEQIQKDIKNEWLMKFPIS
jgi:hypothetical protein